MAAAAESSQQTHFLEQRLSTLRQQQQHFAFLRSDASQLQQKVVREIGRIEAHTEQLKEFFLKFVDEFCDAEALPHGEFKYRNFLQEIANGQRDDLPVSLVDVRSFFAAGEEGVTGGSSDGKSKAEALGVYEAILVNTTRYLEVLHEAAGALLSREELFAANAAQFQQDKEIDAVLGLGQNASFQRAKTDPWRRIRADVVRVQPPKPMLRVAAYECEACHDKAFQPVEDAAFLPLTNCPQCLMTQNRESRVHFHSKLSVFLPFQEIKVQEPTDQVPEADVPRSMTCHVLGHSLVGKLQPGMRVSLAGVLTPVRRVGFAGTRSGLIQEKVFSVCHLNTDKQNSASDRREEAAIAQELETLRSSPGLYEVLAESVAPGVFGLMDVKKALLLQLIGGCTRVKADGGLIRGDLHVLLMGDPGVAKSQLMRRVCAIARRGIYTTGKGSSSTGLTAAVVKDPHTQETSLEGGALVLADRGICCIDEFDKMDDFDRSAIYEVMEQQSVSIAKAGHCSCLPARSAVLAAANPKDGRYDVRKSMMANMNLPAALLSRFDLQFLMLDKADAEQDAQMAAHILGVYQGGGAEGRQTPTDQTHEEARRGRRQRRAPRKQQSQQPPKFVDKKVLRAFIENAKNITPVLPESLVPQIAEWYASTRFDEQQDERLSGILPSYTTPRALLGVVRLSQALARLRESSVIESADFEEALRLLETSKASVRLAEETARRRRQGKVTQVFDILRRMRMRLAESKGAKWNGYIPVSEAEQQAAAVGVSPQQLMQALDQYEELSILVISKDKTKVAFVEDARGGEDSDEDENEAVQMHTDE